MRSLLVLAVGIATATASVVNTSRGGDDPREPMGSAKVSLVLLKASATRGTSGVAFRCDVRLDNGTGKDLKVRSHFTSAFDAMELVVTDKDGKTLTQWGLSWHQSPFSPPGREFVLKQGSTEKTLVFPVSALPREAKTVRARLVGTLPGSAYTRILSTETLEIDIRQEEARP